MTKKHFVKLADAVRGKGFTKNQLEILADFCKGENPNFKKDLWLDYIDGLCGPSGGKI